MATVLRQKRVCTFWVMYWSDCTIKHWSWWIICYLKQNVKFRTAQFLKKEKQFCLFTFRASSLFAIHCGAKIPLLSVFSDISSLLVVGFSSCFRLFSFWLIYRFIHCEYVKLLLCWHISRIFLIVDVTTLKPDIFEVLYQFKD